MSHGPEHHIEHAEHAQHAAYDPFDRKVVMSVAIVAAVLACVTMLGHREHNETLRLQGEAIRMQAEAGIYHSQASNKWALYQAQNIRSHSYQAQLANLSFVATRPDSEEKAAKYWSGQVKKYEKNLKEWRKEAEDLTSKSEGYQTKAGEYLQKSHDAHARADRFDYGELSVQLGLVLCSLAVLTKKRSFWYAGLGCAVLGALVAVSGLLGLFMGSPGHH
jgi:hypothetical protein